MEEWRKYNDDIIVSSQGNVKVNDYYYEHKNRWGTISKTLKKGGIVKPYDDGKGYLRFNYKGKTYFIHRIVAETFIDNPNNLPYVNHKNENTSNNHVSNLEWCTKEYNDNYGTARERAINHKRKIVYQYTLENKIIDVYNSIKETSENGFNPSCVNLCCNGKLKTHKGYKWSYKPL